jgi:hypothetical protein
VGVQWVATQIVIHVARAIAATTTLDSNVRRDCSRLLAQGLECATATRYHVILNIAAALGLLCLIRSFDLHLTTPMPNRHASRGFLPLQAKVRAVVQSILAAPITAVYTHSRVSRQELWKHAGFLFVQAALSLGVFLVGNLLLLVAMLPVCYLLHFW